MARKTSKGLINTLTANKLPRHVHRDTDIEGIDEGATNNQIYSQSSEPSGGTDGDLWWDTVNRTMYTHDGSNWSTAMSADGVSDGADVTTPTQIACKINFSAFSTPNAGETYIHGYDGDGDAADVDPTILIDGVSTTISRGRTNPNAATDIAYIIYDESLSGTTTQRYMLGVKAGGVWTKYYEGTTTTAYTPDGSEVVIGVIDQDGAESTTSAAVWGYGMRMSEVPDILADVTQEAGVNSYNNPEFFLVEEPYRHSIVTNGTITANQQPYYYQMSASTTSGDARLQASNVDDMKMGPAFNVGNNFRGKVRLRSIASTSVTPNSTNRWQFMFGNTGVGTASSASYDGYGVMFRHTSGDVYEVLPIRQSNGSITYGSAVTLTQGANVVYSFEVIKTGSSTVNVSLYDETNSASIFDTSLNFSVTGASDNNYYAASMDINSTNQGEVGSGLCW